MSKAKAPPIVLSKHPEFKVIHASGAWILLKDDEGLMKFFLDIPEAKLQAGKWTVDRVNREFQIEVRMTLKAFIQTADYMAAHIKELEKKGIVKRGKKPEKGAETYRV